MQKIHNLRIKNRRRYAKQTYDIAHIIHHATKQVSVRRDMKKWGKRAEDEVSKELNKFHMRESLLPLDTSHMKEEKKIVALEHLMLLEEIRTCPLRPVNVQAAKSRGRD